MELPTLYTQRLIIRPLSILDADDMYEYAKTPYVGHHIHQFKKQYQLLRQ